MSVMRRPAATADRGLLIHEEVDRGVHGVPTPLHSSGTAFDHLGARPSARGNLSVRGPATRFSARRSLGRTAGHRSARSWSKSVSRTVEPFRRAVTGQSQGGYHKEITSGPALCATP